MKVWEDLQQGKPALNEKGESLYLQYLLSDEELRSKLSQEQIRECFNYDYYTKNVIKSIIEFIRLNFWSSGFFT